MNTAFIDSRCANCGKILTDGDVAVIMGDIKIDTSQTVQFRVGMKTRNVYCDVFCLRNDLNKITSK